MPTHSFIPALPQPHRQFCKVCGDIAGHPDHRGATDLSVADEIYRQIGKRAFFMMGAQHFTATPDSLTFKVRGSKLVTHIRVKLLPSDTYEVTFSKVRGINIKTVAVVTDVYVDSLHAVISYNTGLALSL